MRRIEDIKTAPEILMADDNPADIDLTSEVLAQSEGHYHMNSVNDGEEAISFLRREGKYAKAPVPELVILDLNLPRKDGCQVLSNMKTDPTLAKIPVVIFTTSQASSDIARVYEVGANCYLRKPGNLAEFVAAVQSMAEFWLGFASLPQREKR
jgi:chemotaxis family two-component system response regulator Rcp1